MSQTYFVKGLIGKVLAYGGLQIRTSLPQGLQIPADISVTNGYNSISLRTLNIPCGQKQKTIIYAKKKNIKNIAL